MDKNPKIMKDSHCFSRLKAMGRDVSIDLFKGAHKYIARATKDSKTGPKVAELVEFFNHFSQEKIQYYNFSRMTKPLLLELALCVIQEVLYNGIGRAQTLQLELVKTKFGGKTVKIADPFEEDKDELDDAFLGKIDEAFFCLKDKNGDSPDIQLAAGHGHATPYSPFGKDGAFLRPKPKAARSLDAPIEVHSFLACILWARSYLFNFGFAMKSWPDLIKFAWHYCA